MRNKLVLDSCVFNKLFLKEDDRQEAIDLINELGRRDYIIMVPSLFLYEVLTIAIISDFSSKAAHDLIKKYQKFGLLLIDMEASVIDKAIEIADTGHPKSGYPSFYDSSYHALAIENECVFITADRKHYDKTKQWGHIALLKDWQHSLL